MGQSIDTVTYHCEPTVQLTDYNVSSNSTSFLHSEQMFDLGGSLDYVAKGDDAEVFNHSKHDIKRAVVLRSAAPKELAELAIRFGGDPPSAARYEIASVGDLTAGHSATLNFVPYDAESSGAIAFPSFDLSTAGEEQGPKFSLNGLAKLVRGQKSLERGEVRLIGLIENTLPGMHVDPAASQSGKGATLVVANLELPKLTPPMPDKNTHRDIVSAEDERQRDNEPETDDGSDMEPQGK
jgi:hypothetical protein